MSVAMRHTDMFGAVAALSPSVRTDAQYASEEPQSGWENQWGRIFGGIGESGEARITDYYRERCPLHLASDLPLESLEGFGIFIAVGNREGGSLAESNEALHLALSRRGIPHMWRVSDGGHDFAFWRECLPDALRFVDSSFTGREYKAQEAPEPRRSYVYPAAREIDGARVYLPRTGVETPEERPCEDIAMRWPCASQDELQKK